MGYFNLFLSPSTHIPGKGLVPRNSDEILSSVPSSPRENGKVSRILPLQYSTAILFVRKNWCLRGLACSILFPPQHMPRFFFFAGWDGIIENHIQKVPFVFAKVKEPPQGT